MTTLGLLGAQQRGAVEAAALRLDDSRRQLDAAREGLDRCRASLVRGELALADALAATDIPLGQVVTVWRLDQLRARVVSRRAALDVLASALARGERAVLRCERAVDAALDATARSLKARDVIEQQLEQARAEVMVRRELSDEEP